MPTDDVDEFLARIGAAGPATQAPTTDPKILRTADSLRSLLDEPKIPEGSKVQIRNQLSAWGLGAGQAASSTQTDDVDAFLSRVLPPPAQPKPILPDIRETIASRDWGTPQVAAAPPQPSPLPAPVPRGTQQGLIEAGNIDLLHRPVVHNPDGSISSVRSMSFEENGNEILVPTVVGDRVVSDEEAIAEYHRTGKHLGKFSDPASADSYATQLHNDYAAGGYGNQYRGGPSANAWAQRPLSREQALAGATEMGLPPYGGPEMVAGGRPPTAAGELPEVPEPPTPFRDYPGMVAGGIVRGLTAGAETLPALAGAALEQGATGTGRPPFGPRMLGPRPSPEDLADQQALGHRFFQIAQAIQETRESTTTPRPSGPLAEAVNFIGSAPGYMLNPLMIAAGLAEVPVEAAAGGALGLGGDTSAAAARIAKLGQYFSEGVGRTPAEVATAKAMVDRLESEWPMLEKLPIPLREAAARVAGKGAAGAAVGLGMTAPQENETAASYAARAGVSAAAMGTLFAGLSATESAWNAIWRLLSDVGVQAEPIVQKLRAGQPLTDQENEIVDRVAAKVEHERQALPAAPTQPQLPAESGPTRLPWLGQPPPAAPTGPQPDALAYLQQFKPWITEQEIRSTDDPGRLMQVATARMQAYKERYLTERATPEERASMGRPGAPTKLILKSIEDRLAVRPEATGVPQAPRQPTIPQNVQPIPPKPVEPVVPKGEPVAPLVEAKPPTPEPIQPTEEPEYQKSVDALRKMIEQQAAPAKAQAPAAKPKAAAVPRQTIAAGLGHWWEQILQGGPLKYDHIVDTAGQDIATGISKRYPGGTIIAKEGQQLDEVAARLAAQGFESGDELAARNKILEMVEDLAKKPPAGRAVRHKASFGKPDPSIAPLTKSESAGDLKNGEEILTADGSYWTVTAGAGEIKLKRGDGKELTLDEFDQVPIVSHLTVSEPTKPYGGSTGERRLVGNASRRTSVDQVKRTIDEDELYTPSDEVMQGFPEIADYYRRVQKLRTHVRGSEAVADELDNKVGEPKKGYGIEPFQKAPDEMKRHLIAVGGYHMKRGAADLPALTAALTKAIGPGVEPYVAGLHAILSKLPAFAAPKGAEHGPVRVGHAQQQSHGAPGGVRVRPAEGERPAARPQGGGQPQPPEAPRPSPQGAGAAAPYAPESRTRASAGIITVSRDLLPSHSGEDAALLKRLSSPQGLEELRQLLGGRTPMPHQVDAFVRIQRAHLDGHGYVLADGTGTGKTTVAALTIANLLKEKPDSRVLVVLRNPDLVRQWTTDVLAPMRTKTNLYRGAFGFQTRTVNFMTYATMERLWSSDQFGKVTEGFKPDLLIFDESHALKNFYTGETSTALAGERLQTFAGRVLHLSATPFESALHTGYASGLKLWWPEKDWRSFLSSAFDIYYDAQRGLWMGLSPKKLKAIHELLYSSNRMLKNELDFGEIVNRRGEHVTLTTENLFAPRTEAQRAEHERIAEFFPRLVDQLQQTPGTKPSHVRLVRGLEYMVHRSLDEAQKLPHAIEHARRAVAQGKSVIFMLLRKGDTSMERWLQEYEAGERTYKPWSKMPEFIAAMRAHDIEIPSPVRTLEAAFPGAVKITGDQPAGGPLRRAAIDRFQSGDAQVAIVTMSAGAEGLNLQDRTGVRPRAMYVISVPYNATQATQVAGRPFRVGSETNAETYWLFNDTPADRRVAGALAETLRNQHAILRGENVVPTADEIERFQFNELNTETAEPEAPHYGVAEQQMELKYDQEKPERAAPKPERYITVSTRPTGQTLSIPNSELKGPEDAAAIFDVLKSRPTEAAYVLYMRGDTPIAAEMIGMGAINTTQTEPRYVLSAVKHLGADGIILAHNHPSGAPNPSDDDRAMTKSYAKMMEGWGVTLIGHVTIDIDQFGWIYPDGHYEIKDLDASRLLLRAGTVPVVAPHLERQGLAATSLTKPEEAGAYYLTRLKNKRAVSTMFIASNAQRKVVASLLVDGGPTTIYGSDDSTEAVRRLVADTMPMSIIAVTNEPASSIESRTAGYEAVRSVLGHGVSSNMLDDVLVKDAKGYRSGRAEGIVPGPSVREEDAKYGVSEPDRLKARQAIIDEFLEALDTKARIGRMGFMPRSVRAFYNQRTGLIRQRLHGDIEAAVVEGGRRIYDLLFRLAPGGRLEDVGPKQFRRFKSELSALARPSALTIPPIEQGFAQFIRMYVTEPAQAKAVAPEFLPWFEAKLEESAPKIKYALDALRSDWADYRRADPKARGLLTIQSSTLPLGRIKNGTPFERAYDAIFDSMAPVRRVVNDLLRLRGGGTIPASEDAGDLAQIVTARFALAQHMWETGVGLFGKPVEIVSPSPKEVARSVGPDWKEYELYAKARRGMEEVKRGFDMEKDIGLEQDSAEWAIKNLHEKHKVNFAKARKIFHAILQWHRDAGFMTDEAFEAMVKSHPDYSALYRLMDEEIQPRGGIQPGPGTRHTGLWSAIRRFRGSPRPTIPSLEAMAKMLYTIVDRGERNNLAVKLVQLGLSTVGGGRYIEEVPEERWPTVVPVRKALDALRELGINPREVDIPESALDERLVFFQPSWMTPPRPYDWVWIKGRRRLFRFPEPVYDALRGLNREPMNFVTKWLSIPAATLRAGAVGYVPAAWAWIQLKKAPVDFIESGGPIGLAHRMLPALFSMLRKDKEYDKFMRSGAAMAGFVTSNVKHPEVIVGREIARAGHPVAYWSNPANVLREVIAFTRYLAFSVESTARLAEAQGIWPKDAASRAQLTGGAIAARNLGVDYSVKGSVAGLINQFVPFFTAPLSGLRSAGKAMRDRPTRTALQWLLFSATLTTWLWFHNRKQKSYKELSAHERFTYHHWADDENLTSPIRIMPRPFIFGQADALLEGALQWVDERDPQAMEDFAVEFAKSNNVFERAIPTAALAPIENFANLSLRTGSPVSPERGLPSEAYYPWTTETAKSMGRALNYPPAKIEHLAQGWLGTAGMAGLQAADVLTGRAGGPEKEPQALPFLGRFLTYPGRATADSLTRVYELWDESQRAFKSYRYKMLHEGGAESPAASEFYLKNKDLIDRYYRLRLKMKGLGSRRGQGTPLQDINVEARGILDSEQAIHAVP